MKPKLTYMPLEPYKARYTELLSSPDGWAMKAFARKFEVNPLVPNPNAAAMSISTGSVLDSVNRPLWALEQMSMLLKADTGGQIYFDDFFHPGLEALPYSGREFKAYAFCWAQSFDRHDFTRKMVSWMRPYEAMALSVYGKVFVASPILLDLITTAFPGTEGQIEYVGLPFDSEDVRKRADPAFQPEPYDVVFSSRFDKEKQPGFFLDLVEMLPHLKFAICTGHEQLRGDDYASVARVMAMTAKPSNLTLHTNLSKPEYYSVLKASKVQFNCSQQDWVSFTLLEALAHGCTPVYPNYRDFAHVFGESMDFLYSPGNHKDAAQLIELFVQLGGCSAAQRKGLTDILDFHDGTLARITDSMLADR